MDTEALYKKVVYSFRDVMKAFIPTLTWEDTTDTFLDKIKALSPESVGLVVFEKVDLFDALISLLNEIRLQVQIVDNRFQFRLRILPEYVVLLDYNNRMIPGIVEPVQVMVMALAVFAYSMVRGDQDVTWNEQNAYISGVLGILCALKSVHDGMYLNDHAIETLKEESNKHLLLFTNQVSKRLLEIEKSVTTSFNESHNLMMQGVNNFTTLTMSRLSDLRFLRYPSLREPSLVESSCQNLFPDRADDMLYAALEMRKNTTDNKDVKRVSCATNSCGLLESVREHFMQAKEDDNPNLLVICCPRHQYILENMTIVSVKATLTRKNANHVVCFANRVTNGRVFSE